MNLTPQKKIAAKILGVGVKRVWIDPNVEEDLSLALTRDDVRKLISDRVIRKKGVRGVSKGRTRMVRIQKSRGQRRGHGKRKGRTGARQPRKETWINKVRSQRRYLRGLRDNQLITPAQYRKLYVKVKGNSYRSVTHLRNTVEDLSIIKKPKKKRR
ncbi:MAG: 50S ribosomal protein L19e [Candidatus Heimdallarchaeota archaeon]|nr:MAG: 50S ribosomal protein L19e [Candidatus Heimdallarchaeota archaeon]